MPSSSDNPVVGDDTKTTTSLLSVLSDTKYSQLSRSTLNILMNALRDAGVEKTSQTADIILPKIVVIGKQSSGKSSLIEALSEVKLPRDMGACTRCPMEVRLRTSTAGDNAHWLCKVSVTRTNQKLAAADRRPQSAENDESVPTCFAETYNFAVVRNKKDIEEVVHRAQLAVLLDDKELNQFQDRKVFLQNKKAFEDEASGKFSENCVTLDIMGGGIDLTFIDLPGLIDYDDVLPASLLQLML